MGSNRPYDPERCDRDRAALTDKQFAIMKLVLEGNGTVDGRFVPIDLDQLLERLPYKTTKQSMQFSIRALRGRGYIVKGEPELRRGRKHAIYIPTLAARQELTSDIILPWVETTPAPVDVAVGS